MEAPIMEESSELLESDKRRGKRKRKTRHKKTIKTPGGGRRSIRRFNFWRKRKISKKRSGPKAKGLGKKQKDALHLQRTIETWKQRWKNPQWRQKWKLLWGKNRWKNSIRKRWNTDKKWRRKWMKKIFKKWWDRKWRWKWQKRWIDRRWLNKWKKRRVKRRRLWKKRWIKSGARKMGLTFNEFLLTERRLKGLQKNNHVNANRKRRERRFLRERLIRDQLEKREKMKEELAKVGSWSDRMRYLLFNWDYFGPETFGIRPGVIQLKFYMMIAIQGLVTFLVMLYYHLTDGYVIPEEYVIHGLLGLVYFASAMDFFGGIFGMMTSFHLEIYYGRSLSRRERRRRDKKSKCFGCCSQEKKGKDKKILDQGEETTGVPDGRSGSQAFQGGFGNFLEIPGQTSPKRKRSRTRDREHSRTFRRSSMVGSSDENQDTKKLSSSKRLSDRRTSNRMGGRRKVECKCWGLEYLYCSFLRMCFRGGRSRDFVNRMGYTSWILLELAWFLNILFTAYYSWLEIFYKDYKILKNRCLVGVGPVPKYCGEFDNIYFLLFTIVGITFVLRNVFIFVIGMCFSERYLKRCEPSDPYDEMQSTCSDTDMDYSKVPRQILVPHIFSGGRYPYVLPGATRPVDYMLRRIRKVVEKNQKKKLEDKLQAKLLGNRKRVRNRRRLQSTFERDAQKVTAEFRQIRRVQVPLEKGKRRPWRLPVATVVPDVQQLPAELMTTKAWAWLHDESSSTEDEQRHNTEQDVLRQRRLVRWRKSRRKKKAQPVDSAEIVLLHQPNSKTQLPLEVMVLSKLKHLSDRDSTDSTWSGRPASLYEDVSAHSKEEPVDKREFEAVMELMTREEEIKAAEDAAAKNDDDDDKSSQSSKRLT